MIGRHAVVKNVSGNSRALTQALSQSLFNATRSVKSTVEQRAKRDVFRDDATPTPGTPLSRVTIPVMAGQRMMGPSHTASSLLRSAQPFSTVKGGVGQQNLGGVRALTTSSTPDDTPTNSQPLDKSLGCSEGVPGSHERIAAFFNSDTDRVVEGLTQWRPDNRQYTDALPLAKKLCVAAHKASHSTILPSMEALLNQFPLSETEGLALMCLAESLIRVPDQKTRIALLHDQLNRSDWVESIDMNNALWLNSMVFGVATTKQILNVTQGDIHAGFAKVLAHYGEATIDHIVGAIIQQMAFQFVMGESLPQAWSKVQSSDIYSFDMLGEAALTPEDAQNYFTRYKEAADFLAQKQGSEQEPTLSIKLSALHPRYEFHQEEAVFEELYNTASGLISHAVVKGVPVTIDAEETERLEISLKLFEKIRNSLPVDQRSKVGLAVQAYQKRALPVLERLEQHAEESQAQIPIRLVKGAYWDREVKWSQLSGWSEFPVFTNKALTDLSYSACARKLLSNSDAFYPQFATHNPLTIASIASEVGADFNGFEYQRLFGMGEATYNELQENYPDAKCRVYAPVGQFKQLLPYLVRRMVENGANTSFVNQLGREELDYNALLSDPWLSVTETDDRVAKPAELYGEARVNAAGVNITSSRQFSVLLNEMAPFHSHQWQAGPTTVVDAIENQQSHAILNPARVAETVGTVRYATPIDISAAIDSATEFATTWQKTAVSERADALRKTADLFEEHRPELFTLVMREAGKTFSNAQNELREAVDFLRYYANQAEKLCEPIRCPGPSGEENRMQREGIGPFVCVSPWNFPLAIFTGQIAAALVSGNTVIAKPALETPLIGQRVVELMQEAGIPEQALHFMPAQNSDCDDLLWSDPRIRGLAFTGSTATAMHLNRSLAAREGAALPRIIAETGGQNAMIIDSSALLDQAIIDVVESAFDSAGQRCSAARVAYVQKDIFDAFMPLLKGRMSTLTLGNPLNPNVDIGPIISQTAQVKLQSYIDERFSQSAATGKLMFQSAHAEPELRKDASIGHYIPPTVIEVSSMKDIGEERFGPILHVIPFEPSQLPNVVEEINSTGYGLTFGVHTRLGERADMLVDAVQAGNAYINRNTVGAVVETQPFGGRGLSGTGPKAGGPDYLLAFMTAKTVSDNITAKGGDPKLYDSTT